MLGHLSLPGAGLVLAAAVAIWAIRAAVRRSKNDQTTDCSEGEL